MSGFQSRSLLNIKAVHKLQQHLNLNGLEWPRCCANLEQIILFPGLEVYLLRLRCTCPIMILLQSVNPVVLAQHTETDTFWAACWCIWVHAACWIISNASFYNICNNHNHFFPTTKAIKGQKYEYACSRSSSSSRMRETKAVHSNPDRIL